MRWRLGRRSDNVEDRRSGGGGAKPRSIGGIIGIGLLMLIGWIVGIDPMVMYQILIQQPTASVEVGSQNTPKDEAYQFMSAVLADTEDTWHPIFKTIGKTYKEPKLVLFRDKVRSACGFQSAAVGPFYCPADHQLYIDLSFFDALAKRFGAPGDFAQAYVIAHEVGHHVQALLGISRQVAKKRRTLPTEQANILSVRQELQADCYAGIWAHHAKRARNLLEKGDIEEGLRAASAIGDDTLQKEARGYVTPETFTHGTSKQRVQWFKIGFKTGAIEHCDTFSADI